jgi:hypothetical protein
MTFGLLPVYEEASILLQDVCIGRVIQQLRPLTDHERGSASMSLATSDRVTGIAFARNHLWHNEPGARG